MIETTNQETQKAPEAPMPHENFIRHWLTWWLTPRAKDRDDAFRERVIRSTLLIVVVLALLSFASGVLVFRSEWTLISYPTLHVVGLALCFISGYTVHQGKLLTAGWFLVLTVLLGVSGVLLLARQDQSLTSILGGITAYMLVPVMVTLLLPRSLIIPMSVVTTIAYWLTQLGFQADFNIEGFSTDQQISTLFILLFIEGALLRQLRLEFDARFQAMQQSLQDVEKARMQAERDRHRAEEADKTKSQFLANMSHELRTPLNAIIGYDEAMLGGMVGEFSPKQTQLLGHIQHNSRRLLSLINDILDLSKIESGSLEIYLSPISPRKNLKRTVESLQSLATEKNIYLQAEFEDSVPEVVLCDANKLEQIVINLIGNAIKFTTEGGVTVTAGSENREQWYFSVRDTGIGIPPEQQPRVFDPFHQVDNSFTRKHKGTGLGLAITKRLVEELGGTLELKSEVGKGSEFIISLPKAAVPEPTEDAEAVVADANRQ